MGSSLGPAYLSDGLWAIMKPILCGRGPITYGPSLRMGDDPFSDGHRVLFPNALRNRLALFFQFAGGCRRMVQAHYKVLPRCPFYIGTRAAPINGLCRRRLSAIWNGFGPISERGGRRAENGGLPIIRNTH
jgi:hypothetical protein